jgi:hypothetical protein
VPLVSAADGWVTRAAFEQGKLEGHASGVRQGTGDAEHAMLERLQSDEALEVLARVMNRAAATGGVTYREVLRELSAFAAGGS